MPEIVAALGLLSRDYAEQLRSEGDREYLGLEGWEQALGAAIRNVEGPDGTERTAQQSVIFIPSLLSGSASLMIRRVVGTGKNAVEILGDPENS